MQALKAYVQITELQKFLSSPNKATCYGDQTGDY